MSRSGSGREALLDFGFIFFLGPMFVVAEFARIYRFSLSSKARCERKARLLRNADNDLKYVSRIEEDAVWLPRPVVVHRSPPPSQRRDPTQTDARSALRESDGLSERTPHLVVH